GPSYSVRKHCSSLDYSRMLEGDAGSHRSPAHATLADRLGAARLARLRDGLAVAHGAARSRAPARRRYVARVLRHSGSAVRAARSNRTHDRPGAPAALLQDAAVGGCCSPGGAWLGGTTALPDR